MSYSDEIHGVPWGDLSTGGVLCGLGYNGIVYMIEMAKKELAAARRLSDRGISPDLGTFRGSQAFSDRQIATEVARDEAATFIHIQGDDRLDI